MGHRRSILQDLMAGRPMEVDALYATPLEMAEMVGVQGDHRTGQNIFKLRGQGFITEKPSHHHRNR